MKIEDTALNKEALNWTHSGRKKKSKENENRYDVMKLWDTGYRGKKKYDSPKLDGS